MKKFFLFVIAFAFAFALKAQKMDVAAAKQLVTKNSNAIGMKPAELQNYIVNDAYSNEGTDMVYLLQSYKNLPVLNQMRVLAFKNGNVISHAGGFLADMVDATKNAGENPALTAETAVGYAFQEAKILPPSFLIAKSVTEKGRKKDFGIVSGVTEKVTAELMWIPVINNEGKITEVKLGWQVQVVPTNATDWWLMHVDATSGKIISKHNLTVNEKWEANQIPELLRVGQNEKSLKFKSPLSAYTGEQNKPVSPTLVGTVNYLVIPYPAESPIHPGGTAAIRTNPWTAATGNATTLQWHNDGTTDYTISRGNNAWATEDTIAANQNTGLPATSTTGPDPLNFNFPPNYNSPDPSTDPNFQQFAITNLFYWNNIVHDVSYQYGFNEVSGNFQKNNLSRGGNQNDDVMALAQSGGPGPAAVHIGNNANFSTPPDGGRPRMRMYLFNAVSSTLLTVNTPPAIAGNYAAVESGFSTANKLAAIGPVSGQVKYYDDQSAGTTHEACGVGGTPSNPITGKVALINRGTCSFVEKVKNAQNAGAIAVIMINNVPGAPIIMGGTDNTITIPAIMISDVNGAAFVAQLGNNLTVTMSGTGGAILDGDLDNGVISHEFTHGISNRFTGGPATTSCLQNAEQGGEGWSDYVGLMLTTNWATATLSDGPIARGIGTYVIGQPATGAGIRTKPYSTNLAVNPLTYADMGTGAIGTEVHNIGEIWCMAIWEMTWAIIQQEGTINPNLYNFTPATTGGNSIALKLVFEGMKLQPCSPGYIDARNAILAADRNLYCGRHACSIWTAFAKRGMGFGASQGSSFSATDQTPSTSMPTAPAITTQPVDVTVAAGANATFTANAGSDVNLIYQWQVSTDGGVTYTDINCSISSTLTLTAVTASMNGYKYRARVFIGCATTNTAVATLNILASTPVITTQPANTTVCAGTDAGFSVVATGTGLSYQWQVSTNGGGTFANIPSATSATLTVTAVTLAMNNNQYRVIVTNSNGSVTSSSAILTVNPASSPVITQQPLNTAACTGGNATFTVSATGANLTYQWQVSTNGGVTFSNVAAATTNTLTLTGVTAGMNNNQYLVIITGGCPSTNTTTSSAAVLTVNTSNLSISTNPAPQTVCAGANATFSATATGTGLTYQWQVSTNGGVSYTDIAGATSATYTIIGVTAAMNNNLYRVAVKGTGPCDPIAGVTSAGALLTVQTAPVITAQPTAVTGCPGSSATFTVTATGTNLGYQWQSSATGCLGTFTNIPGAASASYTIASTTVAMSGTAYKVVVTGTCVPAVTSNCAVLTVNSGITISTQPASVTACEGSNAIFSVTATGGTPVYQWQVSTNGGTTFTDISGATGSTLTLTGVTAAMNNNQYHVLISNACTPAITSNNVTLTVQTAAVITTQPTAVTTCTGTAATLTVTATGTNITYQWLSSATCAGTFTNIAGATSASYSAPTLTAGTIAYRVVVSGVCTPPTVTSNCVTITVITTTVITSQPISTTACAGNNASFSVTATGATTYQWQVSTNGGTGFTDISGATSATLNLTGVTGAMNGNQYRLVINGCPAPLTSNVATLTVQSAAAITAQPVDITSCATTATFSVTATGIGITYQWQVSTDGGTTYTNIAGATANTIVLNNLTVGSTGNKYRVVVSSGVCGAPVTSNSVTARVGTAPVVVLTAAPFTSYNPSVTGGLYTTVSPTGNYVYQWTRDGVVLPNVTGPSITAANGLLFEFGTYKVTVTDPVTGCAGVSNTVTITDIAGSRNELFITPNPTRGIVHISYYSTVTTSQARKINVYDSKGGKIMVKDFTVTGRYGSMDLDLTNLSRGTYMIILRDASGKKIASDRIVKL